MIDFPEEVAEGRVQDGVRLALMRLSLEMRFVFVEIVAEILGVKRHREPVLEEISRAVTQRSRQKVRVRRFNQPVHAVVHAVDVYAPERFAQRGLSHVIDEGRGRAFPNERRIGKHVL